MQRKKSIGVNAGLNMIKTLCQIIFPLITFPYVSRVLHVENIGIYNFCQSVVSYFSLAAGLGISTYAIREGARYRENRTEISSFASEVFTINVGSTVLSYAVLAICVICIPRLNIYAQIMAALSASILFTTIGCEWIFQIFEDYGFITVRNIVFQFISLVLLFLFVKNSDDLLIYATITAVSSSGANLINAVSRRKYCKVHLIFNKKVFRHLTPILVLFATSVATTIYTNSDVTMLGALSGNVANGLYAVSTKIYNIVKQMLAAIIIVSIPRLSAYLGQKKHLEFNKTASEILNSLIVLVVPAVVGIFMLSRNIVLIIAGEEYIEATSSLQILSIALFFSIFSWFYTSCILIPNRMERQVLIATLIAALVNIGLNFCLIPMFKQDAAAFTTVIAELLSLLITWFYGRNFFKATLRIKDILSVIFGCAGICMICIITIRSVDSLAACTCISVVASMIFYFLFLVVMKNESIGWILKTLRKR